MLINKNTKIIGQNVILVSYKAEHVLKYHCWMQSEELRELTASEPLSLEEEYEMQKSWLIDKNKCTFIILDKERYELTKNEIDAMIGDTNLFFPNFDSTICAEAEIMIAEPWAQGKKCGTTAMILMFLYGITKLGVKEFIVKISDLNDISALMFKKFGFIEVSHSAVFQETTYSKLVDDEWVTVLKNTVGDYSVIEEAITSLNN